MGGGLMLTYVAYGLRISTLRVTHRSLSSRLSTADTLTSQMESIEQTTNGSEGLAIMLQSNFNYFRNGDLVGRLYLQHTAAALHVLNESAVDTS